MRIHSERSTYLLLVILILAGCSGYKIPSTPTYASISLKIIPTFDAPVEIFIYSRAHEPYARMTVQVYSGMGGYDWGEVEHTLTTNIERKVFLDLLASAEKIDFNSLISSDNYAPEDGSAWVLEIGKSGPSLRLVVMSPIAYTRDRGLERLVDLALELLELSEIDMELVKFY